MTNLASGIEIVANEPAVNGKRVLVAPQDDGSVAVAVEDADGNQVVATIPGPEFAAFVRALAGVVGE